MKNKVKSIYGLIGYPVSHSLSPLMHNAAFKDLKLDCEYQLYSLKEEELEGFFKELRKPDSPIFGLNITVPYKEKIIPYLDLLSPYAEKTMAVNTITISEDRKLQGYNTDGPGFFTHLTALGINTSGKRLSMIGCGGVARAIISVLCLLPERPASFRIYDVDKEKAKNLLEDLQKRLDVSIIQVVDSIDDLNIELCDLFINATPVGMKEDDPILVESEAFHPDMFVYDVIYNPAETKLLAMAKLKGAKVSNGLGMLFYQGVLSFQHWASAELDKKTKDKMFEALTKGLHS